MLNFLWVTYGIYFRETLYQTMQAIFCRQMMNCMKAWNYLQKTLDLPLSTEIIRQAHGLMMEDEKIPWWGNIENHLHLQAIIFLHQLAILKDIWWKAQFLGFMKLKKMIQLWPLQICLETSMPIHLKMETQEFVA